MKITRETAREVVFGYILKNPTKSKQTASPKKYPQGFFKDKPCKIKSCGCLFTPKAPSEMYCSDHCAKHAFTIRYLKTTYGITIDQYVDAYVSQQGKCKICRSEGFVLNKNSKMKLCIDHCHTTGRFRGLLCHNCNRGIGLFQDNAEFLKNAVSYIKSSETIENHQLDELVEYTQVGGSGEGSKES
ncbi:MAG: endonuclease VII domain-containing protein [Ekhidna sp.]|nr:endonuclease VII domain-containing protein [Ekhidna sp.]